MFRKTFPLHLAVLLFLPIAAQSTSSDHFNGATWWDHVKVLADDNMEGRETGSEGLRKAEGYVVAQLKKSGVQPAGKDGYYQPVRLVSRQIVEADSRAEFIAMAGPSRSPRATTSSSTPASISLPKSKPRSCLLATASPSPRKTTTIWLASILREKLP
jgi:hypothetical protein